MGGLTRFAIPGLVLIGLASIVHASFRASDKRPPPSGLSTLVRGSLADIEFRADKPLLPSEDIIGPDDGPAKLTDLKGSVLVVNYWATWCPPCVKEMPTLANLQDAFPTNTLQVIPVSVDRVGDLPMAREQLSDLSDGKLPFYADPTYGVVYDTKTTGFPTTIVYNAAGEEVAFYEGETDWDTPEAIAFLEAVVAGES